MRRSAVRLSWLAACLAALLPATAGALEWTSRVDLLAGREDSWAVDGVRSSGPRLDLQLNLDLLGGVGRPGILDYSGGIEYRRYTDQFGSRDEQRDHLSYRLLGRAFSARESPLHLDLSATRNDDSYASAGGASSGILENVYGIDAIWADTVHPRVSAGYQHNDVKRDVPLVGEQDRTLDIVRAGTGFGTSAFSYNLDYRGLASDGTYDSDNFAEHSVNMDGRVLLSRDATVTVSNLFLLRLPEATSDFNPRQEYNSFSSDVRIGQGDETHSVVYHYAHGTNLTAAADLRRDNHRLAYGTQQRLAPDWRLRLSADASVNESEKDGVLERAAGQTLTALLDWRRSLDKATLLEILAGPTIGVLEPAQGDLRLASGGKLTTILGRPLGGFDGHLTYNLSYTNNVGAVRGWALSQQLVAGANGALGAGTFRGQLLFTGNRRAGDVFGDSASRVVSGTTGYTWYRYDLYLNVGISDGTTGAVTGSGDGLFIPAPYDSHSRFVSGGVSAGFLRYLTARTSVAYTSSDIPDRPSIAQTEAKGSLELAYGALRLALEDRYIAYDTPEGTTRDNQVFFRVSRVFGSRY